MTQSKRSRKRLRTVEEDAQLFHPASKKRDLNSNRALLDISELSINGNASNGISQVHGSPAEQLSPHSSASGSSRMLSNQQQGPRHHPADQPSTSQAISTLPVTASNHVANNSGESDDEQSESSQYSDINKILKQAHYDFLQRRKMPFPE